MVDFDDQKEKSIVFSIQPVESNNTLTAIEVELGTMGEGDKKERKKEDKSYINPTQSRNSFT